MEGINDDRPLPFSRENTERVLSLAMQTHQEVPWVGPKDWMPADEWKPIKIKESSEHESGTSSRNKPPLEEALAPRQSQELAPCASSSQRASSQNQPSRTSRNRSSFGLSFGAKWNKISPEPPPRVSPTRPPDASLFVSTSTHQTFYEDGSSWVQEKGLLSSLVQPLSEERVSHGRSAATIQRAARQSPLNINEAIHPDVLRILKEKESLVVACRQDGSSDVASTLAAGMDHFHLVMAVAGEPKSKGDPSAGVDGRGMSMAPRSMAYGQQSQHQRHSETSSYEPRYQQDQESDAQLGSQSIETRPQVSHKDSPSSSVLSSPVTQGSRALDPSFKSAKNLPLAHRESGMSSDGGRGEMMRTFKDDSIEFTKISDVFEVSTGPSPRPKQSRPFLVMPKDAPSSRDSIYAIGPQQEQTSHEKSLSHLNPIHKDPRPAEVPNNMKRTSLPTRRVQSTVALSPEDSRTAGASSSTSHKGERKTGEAFRLFGAERVKAKTSGGGGGRPESSLFNRKHAGLSRDESNNRSAEQDLDLMHRLDRRTKFYAGLQLATSDSERMHS